MDDYLSYPRLQPPIDHNPTDKLFETALHYLVRPTSQRLSCLLQFNIPSRNIG